MAVLDTGSSSTVIDHGFAIHHNLPILSGPHKKRVQYVDREAEYDSYKVEVEIRGQDNQVKQTIIAQTVNNFSKCCGLVDWKKELDKYPFMQNVYCPSAPYPPLGTMLIGTDNAILFDTLDKRRGSPTDPLANLTPLGWAFMGPMKDTELEGDQEFYQNSFQFYSNSLLSSSGFSSQCFKSQDDYLDQLVAREFTLDTLGLQEKESPFQKGFAGGPRDPSLWSEAEKTADNKLVVKYNEKEKFFTASIPWKDNHFHDVDCNFNAVRLRQEKSHSQFSLDRKGVQQSEIDTIISNYVEKKYIEEVPISDQGKGWYLPFFEVVNRAKSTPIRLVFDAKAKYKGVSLNNQIEDTPNRLNDIVSSLLKLRQYEYGLTGDISEMFLRVRMNIDDRKFHRFIHNGKHYQWTRILFGNKSSPNASQKVLSTLAKDNVNVFPEACVTLEKTCYMDDCVDSRSTEKELVELANQLPALLLKADMRLCKIYTDSKLVAQSVPKDLLAKEISFEDKDPLFDSNKVLGMKWEAQTKHFTYDVKFKTVEEWKKVCGVTVWTKRAILKTTASTYDPLGLICPIVMFPRTIIQELWSKKLDWDTPLDDEYCRRWENCLKNLLDVKKLSFFRWSYDFPGSKLELHVFCDSSEKAFATCVYSRVNSGGGEMKSNLLMAKSRVAPIKNESIPRLELVACVIGTRLLNAVNLTFKVPQERIFYHTDSRNALYWINTPAYKSKTYVYNRSSEIQRVSEPTQWSHVATDINPADIATRPISSSDLSTNKIWSQGPPFLRDLNFVFKPFDIKEVVVTEEIKKEMKTEEEASLFFFNKCHVFIDNKLDHLDVGKYWNNLQKFRRVLMLVVKFVFLTKKVTLTKSELFNKANLYLYKLSQRISFEKEIELLESNQKLSHSHQLNKFNPFLDEFGLLRSNSRLSELSYLPEDMRKPILLIGKNPITRALVLEQHFEKGHAVSEALVRSTLHSKFIILGITKLLKSISQKCFWCRKRKAEPVNQQMAPIKNRLLQRAFAETGIDFAGPFETTQGRGKVRKVRFVLVLTCLQTRAVHFEPTFNQTTESVINALDRFCSVRGRPSVIVSDNQTSFKKASKVLKDFVKFFFDNQKQIEIGLDKDIEPIDWLFIPPRAPHFGGAWEIMVKAMKRALTAISNEQVMDEDNFNTFLCRAMDMINNRPLLRHYSTDTPHILTPNNFIIGRVDTSIFPFVVEPQRTRLGTRYIQLEEMTNSLWHRFINEILPELSTRQKWKAEFNDLQEGTVVLVVEPNLPRGLWKVGLVVEVFKSRDNFARSARVKIGKEIYPRPIANLIPLINE